MRPYRIKRHRRREHGGSHMALVPFIDMLTILVVFLLVHASDVEVLSNSKNISVPLSISDKKPRDTVVVMLTKSELLIQGRVVATLDQLRSSEGLTIEPLKRELKLLAAKMQLRTATQSSADREVAIMGDRSVPYAVIKKVIATCTDAEYGKVSLVVIERERAAEAGPAA